MATIKGFEVSGTIYENEDETARQDIADLPTYIRNQNILSDFETLGSGTSLVNYTSPFDGVLYVHRNSGVGFEYSIRRGDITFAGKTTANNGGGMTSVFPIRKGDIILIGGNSSEGIIRASFYKLRDYSDR